MSLTTLTEFFGWCTVLNLGLLVLTSIGLVFFRGPVARIHGGMFGIDEARLSEAYFTYLANYKIMVLVFAVVPYVALRVMA